MLFRSMRRCLQVSKRSVDFAKKDYIKSGCINPIKINGNHVLEAAKELFDSHITKILKYLTEYELMVLSALIIERTHSKNDIIPKSKLYTRTEQVIGKMDVKFLKEEEVDYIVIKLHELGLITLDDKGRRQLEDTITVNVFNDEFITSLQDKEKYKDIIELIEISS